jgi:hypothetical protein
LWPYSGTVQKNRTCYLIVFKLHKTQTKSENYETCRDIMISYVHPMLKNLYCFVKVVTYYIVLLRKPHVETFSKNYILRILRKMLRFLREKRQPDESSLISLLFLNHFIFSIKDFHWQFYYLGRQWKSISTSGSQLPACKRSLVLIVLKNVSINRLRTTTIELLCTSALTTIAARPP